MKVNELIPQIMPIFIYQYVIYLQDERLYVKFNAKYAVRQTQSREVLWV